MGRKRVERVVGAQIVRDGSLPNAVTMELDGLAQSHVDLDDPENITFEYVRRFRTVVDLHGLRDDDLRGNPERRGADPIRIAHLGGGVLSLARYVAAVRPRSAQTAVEVDPEVVELARSLGVPAGIRIRTADAAAEVAKLRGQDAIVVDVFADGVIPVAFARPQFTADVLSALAEGGILAWNIGDGGGLEFSRRIASGFRAAGCDVVAMAEPSIFRGRRFGNVVLVASRSRLPVGGYTRRTAIDAVPGRVEADFGVGARPFTDADARPSDPPPEGFRR